MEIWNRGKFDLKKLMIFKVNEVKRSDFKILNKLHNFDDSEAVKTIPNFAYILFELRKKLMSRNFNNSLLSKAMRKLILIRWINYSRAAIALSQKINIYKLILFKLIIYLLIS